MAERTLLHYTKHSGKLKGLYSLSTSTKANPFCKAQLYEVCTHCYADRISGFRKTLEDHLRANYDLLQMDLTDYYLKVPSYVGPHLRLHSFGELGSRQHAQNFVRLAQLNPSVQMTLWTKRPQLLKTLDIPENLSVLWSLGRLDLPEPDALEMFHHMKALYPFLKGGYYVGTKAKGFQPCGTSCSDCMRCYPPKQDVLISQLLH